MSKPDYHAAAAEVERLIADGLSQDNARKAVKAAHPALHGASLRRAHNAATIPSRTNFLNSGLLSVLVSVRRVKFWRVLMRISIRFDNVLFRESGSRLLAFSDGQVVEQAA